MRRQLSGTVSYCWPNREHVPQPELRLHAAVGLPRDAAGHQRLRVDGLPVLEARHRVDVDDLLEVGLLVDRREQAGAAQIAGDDAGDVAADLAVGRSRHAGEVGQRDRHRLHGALRDVELRGRAEGVARIKRKRARPCTRDHRPPRRQQCLDQFPILHQCRFQIRNDQPRYMSRGSKVISISFQRS
jgi:hypothetical protein